VKRLGKLSTDRARRFCQALAAESEGAGQIRGGVHARAVSRSAYDETAQLAVESAEAGYVTHDQSQFIKAGLRGRVQPHSVPLNQAGRDLAKGKR
jgi:hypothetical protein